MRDNAIQRTKKCFFCPSKENLELHNIFPDRDKCSKYGMRVWLCSYHHTEQPEGVHYNKDAADLLHEIAQFTFERTHTRKQFVDEFGQNYLKWDTEGFG